MKKEDIAKQRQIGAILTKLDPNDRKVLEDYMESLEAKRRKSYKPKGIEQRTGNITKAFSGQKPLNSKFFTEDEIHQEILDIVKDENKDIKSIEELIKLDQPSYMILRKAVLAKLHNRKKR